jgi:hypothetical protein
MRRRAPDKRDDAVVWSDVPSQALSRWCALILNMPCEVTGAPCNGNCERERERREREAT